MIRSIVLLLALTGVVSAQQTEAQFADFVAAEIAEQYAEVTKHGDEFRQIDDQLRRAAATANGELVHELDEPWKLADAKYKASRAKYATLIEAAEATSVRKYGKLLVQVKMSTGKTIPLPGPLDFFLALILAPATARDHGSMVAVADIGLTAAPDIVTYTGAVVGGGAVGSSFAIMAIDYHDERVNELRAEWNEIFANTHNAKRRTRSRTTIDGAISSITDAIRDIESTPIVAYTKDDSRVYENKAAHLTELRYIRGILQDARDFSEGGDANEDGRVDVQDFLRIQANYNAPGGWEQGDFDEDGFVGFSDFLILSDNWDDPLPPPPLGD